MDASPCRIGSTFCLPRPRRVPRLHAPPSSAQSVAATWSWRNPPGMLAVPLPRRYDMARPRRYSSDTLQYFWDRYIGDDPERIAEYEQAEAEIDIARLIYSMRTAAPLTQRQLAKKVGTTASVICRLEDADYQGHSLAMLRRIAAALGKRVEIRF